jgi:hypothetical protein
VDLVVRRSILRHPPRITRQARPGGSARRMVALESVDDARYRDLVARAAAALERSLGPAVVANRVVGAPLVLEDWRVAHARWRAAIGRSVDPGLRVHVDVADCYDSIGPEVVAASLRSAGADPRALVRLLHELVEHGVPGLPIGPEASAVLANAVLAPVDLALAAAGVPHARWVDDVVAFAPGRRRAVVVTAVVHRELEALGLRLNEGKTRIEDPRIPARSSASATPMSGARSGAGGVR